jgi:hypothetical protein
MYHCKKVYEGVEVKFYAFLTLAVDGDEWLASSLENVTPKEENLLSFRQEAVLFPQLIWLMWQREKSCSTGNEPQSPSMSSLY